jgi:TonB-linked SusC/RagA family outer membrane protein
MYDMRKKLYYLLLSMSILAISNVVNAQVFEVSGIVSDEDGSPVVGASIVVKGSTVNKVTGSDGRFSLFAPDANAILQIAHLGYVPVEVKAGKDLNITLVTDVNELEDVVVTGYQTLPRTRTTGAFETVSPELLAKPTTNIGSRLIGTVSGIQVTSNATGDLTFEIRGKTSLNANANPLIVVDGFPVEGDLGTLNPNDVESVTILKDAAAASIWGAQSANGVISITTRGGKLSSGRSETKIEFNSFLRFAPRIDLEYARSLASSAETIEYEKMAFDAWSATMPTDAYNSMSSFSPGLVALNEHHLGYLSETEMNALLESYKKLDNSEQIKKYLLQNPFTQQYNLNISGSNGRISNNLSLLYEDNAYYAKGRDDWKTQISHRTNVHFTKWLDFNFSGTFSYKSSTDNSVSTPGIFGLAPYEMLIDENGDRTNITNGWYQPNLNRYFVTGNFPYEFTYNPVTELESRDFTTTNINARIQAGLTFKILKGLTFDTKAQYELISTLGRNFYKENSYTVRSTINQSSSYDRNTDKVTLNLPLGGFLDQSRLRTDLWNFRNQINFDHDFNGVHRITAIAGSELSERIAQTFNYPRAYGYNDDRLTTSAFPNGPGGTTVKPLSNWVGATTQTFAYINSFAYNTDRFFSLYGNVAYTFDNKYTLSGSARTDASNLISDDPKYRYAPFWSVGGSWMAGQEAFLKDIEWLSLLKIRFTYGYNGNVDKSTSFMPLINMGTALNQYTQGYTATVASYGNPDLRWERTGTWNLGIDYSLFKGKIFGKIELYNKNSKDLIATISIPSVNGTTSQKLNNAALTNNGIELEIGTSLDIVNKDITWRGNLNMSYNKNKITDLFVASYAGYDLTMTSPAYVEGYDANTIWTYVYDGVRNLGSENTPNWQPTIKGPDGSYFDFGTWPTGEATQFCLPVGSRVAPFIFGLTNSFQVYDFDISFIVTGKFGHKFARESFNYPAVWGARVLPNSKLTEVLNGDPAKIVPLPMNGSIEGRYYFWDRFYPYLDYLIEDAGHIRLQEVNLAYNLPATVAKKIGLDALQIYGQATNLLSIYLNKFDEDPEFPRGSIKPSPYFTLGFKVTF